MTNALDKIGVKEIDNNDYEGSPFLESSFLPSTIQGVEGVYLLQYNIYNDEILLKQEEQYFKVPKKEFNYFNINNKFVIRLINNNYYIQLSKNNDKYIIVKKEQVKYTPSQVSETGYDQNRSAKFTKIKPLEYLYIINDNRLILLEKNKIKHVFPSKSEELDVLFKKNKFKSMEDYDRLINLIL